MLFFVNYRLKKNFFLRSCQQGHWIPDISVLFSANFKPRAFENEYAKNNPNVDLDELAEEISKLTGIANRQIGVIELDHSLDIDEVTEIFIRINSKGTALSQSDFVMSKMAADTDHDGSIMRKAVDYFCHLAVKPEFYENLKKDTEFQQSIFADKIKWLAKDYDDIYDPGYSDILSFLEIEKESEIEADVETIFSIASKYKLNWDNEHFVASNHKMVLDIQRTARKNMLSYEKKVNDIVRGKKLIVAHAQVKSALQDLLKKFKYYRLSLYTFSMSSLMEVMLGGNFNEEYVSGIKDEIRQMSEAYRDLFAKCSVYLENLSSSSIEKNFLAGIGTAGKAVGTLIGNIPGIKEGPVDEFLVDQGSRMEKSAHSMQAQSIKEFAEISNPQTGVFVDRLEDVIRIFNHTDQICFDRENIYLM